MFTAIRIWVCKVAELVCLGHWDLPLSGEGQNQFSMVRAEAILPEYWEWGSSPQGEQPALPQQSPVRDKASYLRSQ